MRQDPGSGRSKYQLLTDQPEVPMPAAHRPTQTDLDLTNGAERKAQLHTDRLTRCLAQALKLSSSLWAAGEPALARAALKLSSAIDETIESS